MAVDGKTHIAGVLRAVRGPLNADNMHKPVIPATSPSMMVQLGAKITNVALPTNVSEYSPKEHPLQEHKPETQTAPGDETEKS